MSSISKPNTFSASTPISSSQVNANFDTIYNDYNGGISEANLADDAVTTDKVADSAVTTVKIADAVVTPAKLVAGTGTSWAWQSWTPTWTNLTVGNGTVDCTYVQIGKTVIVKVQFTFGSTSSVSGSPQLTLPVTAKAFLNSGGGTFANGWTTMVDSGSSTQIGMIELLTTTSAQLLAVGTASTYLARTGIGSTVPFTWGTGDYFTGQLIYEAA